MDLGLKGRRAVVAGASRGLGRAIALALAAEGAAVTALARNAEGLRRLAGEAPAPGSIEARACNLADAAAIESLSGVLAKADVLVLNTGGPPPATAAEASDAQWHAQFESLFLSAVRLTRLALPGMRQRRHGRIIAVVSSGVLQPIANLAMSNAMRLAVVGWAKTLAGEVAGAGITVNCIAPGRIATDRLTELDQHEAGRQGVDIDTVRSRSSAAIPAQRYGDPEEFAAMAVFLASSRASYVTGGILRVDGGMVRGL